MSEHSLISVFFPNYLISKYLLNRFNSWYQWPWASPNAGATACAGGGKDHRWRQKQLSSRLLYTHNSTLLYGHAYWPLDPSKVAANTSATVQGCRWNHTRYACIWDGCEQAAGRQGTGCSRTREYAPNWSNQPMHSTTKGSWIKVLFFVFSILFSCLT